MPTSNWKLGNGLVIAINYLLSGVDTPVLAINGTVPNGTPSLAQLHKFFHFEDEEKKEFKGGAFVIFWLLWIFYIGVTIIIISGSGGRL